MPTTEDRVAYATIDIGTSQIKLGVYCPAIANHIVLVDSLSNELIYGNSGEVQIDYTCLKEKTFRLFSALGSFLNHHSIKKMYLGICGHVSSLIEWNMASNSPPPGPFPIWLDSSSHKSLDEYNAVMGEGKSKAIIGTFLPAGTNWLFTKLLHRRKSGFSNDSIFLQVGDAIYYELCAEFNTHFSSQISMVNLVRRDYAPELLDHLELNQSSLPSIIYEPRKVTERQSNHFGLPQETFVFPPMADLYTSLYGLRLTDREGFVLANTSEQAGAYYSNQPTALANFLSITFDKGFVNYGSTNTGGNLINWLLANVLKRDVTKETLIELTTRAALIRPEHTPIVLPYLQGERAPLWNSTLSASILELKSLHTDVHLFRAVLESIGFARKQCFEQIGIDELELIKIAGGSSKNHLWNCIRASVLKKPLAVADEKELAMAGIIDYMMQEVGSPVTKAAINFKLVNPDSEVAEIYDEKYRKFIRYQNLIS